MIERRAIIAGLLSAVGVPGITRAQSLHAVHKIGYLQITDVRSTTGAADQGTAAILAPVWQKLGYVEGETILARSAQGDLTRIPALLAELIAMKVGVLIVVGAVTVKAASQATATTPIVAIDLETDPVRAGYAASIARPGGNITGLFMDTASLAEKWMELLREIVPGVERVALIWDPTTGSAQLDVAKAAARSAGIEAVVVEFRAGQDYQEVFRNLGRQKRMGAIQLTTPVGNAAISSIAMAAQKSGLPAISFQKSNTQRGALLSYGPDQWSYFPRAVVLADRILKGAKAAELPIERPTRFELVINMKTAKALGLTIPPSLLARADEVIE